MTEPSAATLDDMAGEVPYALRLPKELKEDLAVAAKANRRSLNSEIVIRLEQSVAAEKKP